MTTPLHIHHNKIEAFEHIVCLYAGMLVHINPMSKCDLDTGGVRRKNVMQT